MRGLYYRFRYAEFRHPRGVAMFADRCMGAVLHEYADVKKTAAGGIQKIKERVKGLRVERTTMDPENAPSFEDTLRNAGQLRFEQVLWWLLVLAEGALTYFAALVFLPGRGLILGGLRMLIAVIATGIAVVVAEKFTDEFLAQRVEGEAATSVARRRMWSWGILLVGLECALWGLASIRATDMEGSSPSAALYYGLVLLSVLIAPAAGGIRHDLMKRLAPVRRVQRIRAIDRTLEECAKQLAHARHRLESEWEGICQGFFNRFADFRAYKEVYNAKHQIVEETTGAFFNTRGEFCAEARKQRDATYGEMELLFDDDGEERLQDRRPVLTLEPTRPQDSRAVAVGVGQ